MSHQANSIPPCLENLVGIRGDCEQAAEPHSGLYLNDLEGVSLPASALTANAEDATGLRLMRRKLELATRAVADDLRAALEKHGWFRWRAELASVHAGTFGAGYLPASTAARGIRLIRRTTGRLSRILVQSIELLSENDAAGVTLTIQDGAQTLTRTVDLLAGVPQLVETMYAAASESVFVLISHPTARFNDSRIAGGGGCGCGQAASRLSARGWNGLYGTTQTWGLRVQAALTCDDWELLCLLRHRLGPLVRDRAAAELLSERLYSERMNALTADPDRARALRDERRAAYETQLADLTRQLPDLLRGLDPDCITCKGARSAHLLP